MDLTDQEHPKAGKAELLPGITNLLGAASAGLSPDGRWIAYTARDDSSPAGQIFVQPFPPTGGKWRISTDGGTFPVWARNSHELFFVSPGQIMVADYRVEGGSFVAGKPRVWIQRALSVLSLQPLLRAGGTWDIAPDGKRAIATASPEGKALDFHLTFLLNFTDELRRRLTLGK